jgi:hypothetical protein
VKTTKIKQVGHNRVLILFQTESGQEIKLDLYAPIGGGYVYYGDHKQICEKLQFTGPTLMWGGSDPLISLVRREYKRRRDAERRDRKKREAM